MLATIREVFYNLDCCSQAVFAMIPNSSGAIVSNTTEKVMPPNFIQFHAVVRRFFVGRSGNRKSSVSCSSYVTAIPYSIVVSFSIDVSSSNIIYIVVSTPNEMHRLTFKSSVLLNYWILRLCLSPWRRHRWAFGMSRNHAMVSPLAEMFLGKPW